MELMTLHQERIGWYCRLDMRILEVWIY